MNGNEPWTQTSSGRAFPILNPQSGDVCTADIAHSLALICRYGGHTIRHYSVAQHCIYMSHVVREDIAVHALLHDAAEAYVGDLVTPVKRLLPDFNTIEDHILEVIYEAVQVDPPTCDQLMAVKEADIRTALAERAQLLRPSKCRWDEEYEALEPYTMPIYDWTWQMAEHEYLKRLRKLGIEVTV